MERLNDIMGRTPQRRQSLPEPRSSQGFSSQGQRVPQPQTPISHRPLHEQRANQGQQQNTMPATTRARLTQNAQWQQQNTLPANSEKRSNNKPVAHPTTYNEYKQRRTVMDTTSTYQSGSKSQPKPYIQTMPPQPPNGYYTHDDYAIAPQADSLEEWDEEEEGENEEEEHISMGYGDWEQTGNDVIVYRHPDVNMLVEPRPQYPPAYRERSTADVEPSHTNPMRDVRGEARLPATIPAAHAQTAHAPSYQQRITQPLNPQAITGLARERGYTQPGSQREQYISAPDSQQQVSRPAHQIIRRELPEPVMRTPGATRYVCPRCKGAGFLRTNVPFGHPNFGKPVACACKEAERKEKRRQELRDISNMDAFHNQVFDTFNARISGVQEAFNAALDFAESPYGWLLLVGPNGCGKTHLAAAIANHCLENGAVVLFEAVPDLLDHLRAAFAPSANEVYDQLFTKMRNAELLVLDDLGAQQSSSWANEKLFQLLNHRYNMGMPTVITANPKGIQGIDERIRSRLMDSNLVSNVTMDRARDYRPTQPKKR